MPAFGRGVARRGASIVAKAIVAPPAGSGTRTSSPDRSSSFPSAAVQQHGAELDLEIPPRSAIQNAREPRTPGRVNES